VLCARLEIVERQWSVLNALSIRVQGSKSDLIPFFQLGSADFSQLLRQRPFLVRTEVTDSAPAVAIIQSVEVGTVGGCGIVGIVIRLIFGSLDERRFEMVLWAELHVNV
jgi:hypothetical protein